MLIGALRITVKRQWFLAWAQTDNSLCLKYRRSLIFYTIAGRELTHL
jgi:hypothetical protein